MRSKPYILMDDCKGGYMLTKYLTELGHRNIAGIFKVDDIQGGNATRGYVQGAPGGGNPL